MTFIDDQKTFYHFVTLPPLCNFSTLTWSLSILFCHLVERKPLRKTSGVTSEIGQESEDLSVLTTGGRLGCLWLCTVVQNNQESRRKYWAICSCVCLFNCTTHSFFCSALLALLACSAVFIRLLVCSLAHSQTQGNDLIPKNTKFCPIVLWSISFGSA